MPRLAPPQPFGAAAAPSSLGQIGHVSHFGWLGRPCHLPAAQGEQSVVMVPGAALDFPCTAMVPGSHAPSCSASVRAKTSPPAPPCGGSSSRVGAGVGGVGAGVGAAGSTTSGGTGTAMRGALPPPVGSDVITLARARVKLKPASACTTSTTSSIAAFCAEACESDELGTTVKLTAVPPAASADAPKRSAVICAGATRRTWLSASRYTARVADVTADGGWFGTCSVMGTTAAGAGVGGGGGGGVGAGVGAFVCEGVQPLGCASPLL